MRTRKIWVIDDDNTFQIIVQKIIKQTEKVCFIQTYKNGYDAINALKDSLKNNHELPDVILLDINMPVMDGWGFLDEIKLLNLKNINCAIYIMTSSISVADKTKAKSYQEVSGFISKPITKELLINIFSTIENDSFVTSSDL